MGAAHRVCLAPDRRRRMGRPFPGRCDVSRSVLQNARELGWRLRGAHTGICRPGCSGRKFSTVSIGKTRKRAATGSQFRFLCHGIMMTTFDSSGKRREPRIVLNQFQFLAAPGSAYRHMPSGLFRPKILRFFPLRSGRRTNRINGSVRDLCSRCASSISAFNSSGVPNLDDAAKKLLT